MHNIKPNPFGGLFEKEIHQAIIPKHDLKAIELLLKQGEPCIIQFFGKKGRGKTMHLRALHNAFPSAPLFFLGQQKEEKSLNWEGESIVFVDSIHLMPFWKRQRLYHQQGLSLVFTTHIDRRAEYFFYNKKKYIFKFSNLELQSLENIIEARLALFSLEKPLWLDTSFLEKLIEKNGDDIRATINELYDYWQMPKKMTTDG